MTKYGSQKTVVDGHKFDSLKEANRYGELVLLQRAGEISDLILQPRFLLQDGYKMFENNESVKVRKIEYVADFQYNEGDKKIVEDVKGMKTETYIIKKKLFMKRYPKLRLRET